MFNYLIFKEASMLAIYIFKLAPITTFSPSNIGITFPSNFYLDSTKIAVSLATQLNYNNLQGLISISTAVRNIRIKSYPKFMISDASIYLTNICAQIN